MALTALPGKRALDASLNLVPFIDLLSCCIAFLLITAVWSQSAQLPARTAAGAEGETAPGKRPWSLLVAAAECTLTAPSGEHQIVPHEQLTALLRRHSVGEQLVVTGADRLPYDVWIHALDAARAAGVMSLDISFGG
jgi:biopolymer transport protein ExbD